MRDFSDSQGELFFTIAAFLSRYRPTDFNTLIDDDVAEAAASLAATFDTASRGLIYDHRPASVVAERLTTALKKVLAETTQGRGSAFERDAAVVLRRVEEAAREIAATDRTNRQAFLDFLRRTITAPADDAEGTGAEGPRLIVP